MEHYSYLIVGGGMAADAAVNGIREQDSSGTIGIISEESYMCYDRPPLSKGLWMGTPIDAIWEHTDKKNVKFHLNRKVVSIDTVAHTATDDAGNVYFYKKLLLATGSQRTHLPFEGVNYLHTLKEYHAICNLYEKGSEFVVIGGGYIGTEIAAAFQMNGKQVTLITQENSLLSYKVPADFSQFLSNYYCEKGVSYLPSETVIDVEKKDEQYVVATNSGKRLVCDGVIAGVGTTPNTQLAIDTNLKCDNGITVDRHLRTSNEDIYAAGDVANFFSPILNMRMRCEHEDAAKTMGATAGRNMAGKRDEYTHLPYFYSDLFEIGYMAIGKTTGKLEMVSSWDELYRQGTIYYVENGCIAGATMVGIWDQVDHIRQLIASKATIESILNQVKSKKVKKSV